jgi:hypothetical protein
MWELFHMSSSSQSRTLSQGEHAWAGGLDHQWDRGSHLRAQGTNCPQNRGPGTLPEGNSHLLGAC